MSKALNEVAAVWWAERLELPEKREALRQALLRLLPEGDFGTTHENSCYSDYDPQGYLLEATQAAGIDCTGSFFSSRGLFPEKSGLQKHGGKLYAKEGYGGEWLVIAEEEAPAP